MITRFIIALALLAGCDRHDVPKAPLNVLESRTLASGFPTSPVNASSIKGLPVPNPTPAGAVLTVAAGPSLIWNVPAAGVMLASTPPADVGSSAVVGVGTTAARSDHVHRITTLTGVTINCASNTCSNIANGALTNSTVTLSCTGLSGCGTVALGGTLSPAVVYGTGSNTATQGNDARLPPIPSGAGKLVYDTGAAYTATATACTAGRILSGGSPPDCTSTPTIGTSLTVPRVDSAGSLILNGATGANVQLSVNSTTVLTAAAAGLTAAQPLAMGGNKVTGLGTATTSGDALAYPWITATNGSASLSAASHTITGGGGVYEDIGLSVTLPAAGTYRVTAVIRSTINTSSGIGYMTAKMVNTTDGDVANSETFLAGNDAVNEATSSTVTMVSYVTVAASRVIKVQAFRNGATTYTDSSIYSDANGRTRMFYEQVAP